ncbi:MAG TPA: hypothetical protein QF901_09985, partial [Gammaproteobacteria bacterium]|nr:hypothetical protein [Gammaproteobacteria bacterium]
MAASRDVALICRAGAVIHEVGISDATHGARAKGDYVAIVGRVECVECVEKRHFEAARISTGEVKKVPGDTHSMLN